MNRLVSYWEKNAHCWLVSISGHKLILSMTGFHEVKLCYILTGNLDWTYFTMESKPKSVVVFLIPLVFLSSCWLFLFKMFMVCYILTFRLFTIFPWSTRGGYEKDSDCFLIPAVRLSLCGRMNNIFEKCLRTMAIYHMLENRAIPLGTIAYKTQLTYSHFSPLLMNTTLDIY